MKLTVIAAALAFFAFGASGSLAAPTEFTKQQSDLFGTGGRSAVWNFSNHPGATATAGGFRVNDGTADLVAWCIDALHFLNLSKPFDIITPTPETDLKINAMQRNNLQKLFDQNYSDTLLSSHDQSAGFQMAIWEILYEAPATVLNVLNGTWTASASNGVVAFANTILTSLVNPTDRRFNLTFYQQVGGQDLVSATAVPLPAAGGLLAVGLIGLYGASRRRRAKASV